MILGLIFSKTITWRDYLESGKEAIIPKLMKKLGALKFTCRNTSYKAKEKLAHGCFINTLVYIIHIWGLHTKPSVTRKVQSVQTNTLKWMSDDYDGSLRVLLIQTKWISVHQLAIYHSVLLYWKVILIGKPNRMIRNIITEK